MQNQIKEAQLSLSTVHRILRCFSGNNYYAIFCIENMIFTQFWKFSPQFLDLIIPINKLLIAIRGQL